MVSLFLSPEDFNLVRHDKKVVDYGDRVQYLAYTEEKEDIWGDVLIYNVDGLEARRIHVGGYSLEVNYY